MSTMLEWIAEVGDCSSCMHNEAKWGQDKRNVKH